ncbi:CNT family concentrative nucleoside transporter [Tahibacter aquaticus]|uniref:CNT family concentrative nucleoside transporter n=2 Tax=Tahibacter aquaticus TaxID=520092 RepID=A0A4R6Z4P1_9GAMM|nr:nucleoside transporter C-terminal domain-containing protein [Tahibacter aquaticus]TDR46640.1 CNT family concentrative nucleoside transporter [Tahibacter aquaticus]
MLAALGHIAFGLFGLFVLVLIAYAFSNNKRSVDWRLVITGISLQIGFATAVLLGGRIETGLAELAPIVHTEWYWFVTRLAVFLLVAFPASWIVGQFLRDEQRMAKVRKVLLMLLALDAVLAIPLYGAIFDSLGRGFVHLLEFNKVGSEFIFGKLLDASAFGFIFAFQVLPTIIFFAALMGVLYYLGVMQQIVKGMTWGITKVMNVSGAETTSVCASVFIGQTEAPLTIKPYLEKMTESELMTVMIGGMAHIAGGVLAAYVGLLGKGDPVQMAMYAKHLLAASIMAAPATLVLAKILIPETREPLTRGSVRIEVENHSANVIDAAASGAGDGLKLALNVGAMLLAFIALIAVLNAPLKWLGTVTWSGKLVALLGVCGVLLAVAAVYARRLPGPVESSLLVDASGAPLATPQPANTSLFWLLVLSGAACLLLASVAYAADGATLNAWLSQGKSVPVTLSLQTILGYVLSPIAWLIGVPWQDAVLVGGFIGEKVVLNEFVAYVDLSNNMHLLQEHSRVVAAYALCGFANFSSIAIQIGGIGGLAPGRRADLARFGLRAVLGGSLATFMTATIAGVLNQL